MKDASKPFAWWFVEAFFGSQVSEYIPVKLEAKPETEEDQAGMKAQGVEHQLPQREESWKWEIRG